MDHPAVWIIRLLTDSPEAVETTAATIPQRIATLDSLALGRPYAEIISVRRSEALSDPPAVALDLDIAAGEVHPSIWFQRQGRHITAGQVLARSRSTRASNPVPRNAADGRPPVSPAR
jgi:hypothetical protein